MPFCRTGEHVPAGFPITGTAVLIAAIDDTNPDKLTVLERGRVGEICIAGVGLASGYHRLLHLMEHCIDVLLKP